MATSIELKRAVCGKNTIFPFYLALLYFDSEYLTRGVVYDMHTDVVIIHSSFIERCRLGNDVCEKSLQAVGRKVRTKSHRQVRLNPCTARCCIHCSTLPCLVVHFLLVDNVSKRFSMQSWIYMRIQQSFVYSRDKAKTVSLENGHEVYVSKWNPGVPPEFR